MRIYKFWWTTNIRNSQTLISIGTYRFNRLTFVAPGSFQQVMNTMLSGLEFATAYLDDFFFIKSKNKEHRHHVLEAFIQI